MIPLSSNEFQQLLDELAEEGFGAGAALPQIVQAAPNINPMTALGRALSTPSANDIEMLENALSYISSDTEYGSVSIFGADGLPLTHYWAGVVMAVGRGYPAAWGQKTCRYHGARPVDTIKRGANHPQYRHGRETLEAKAERSRRLAELRKLEELSFALGLAVGPRWRGRKPRTIPPR